MYAVKYPAESKKELQKRNSIPPLVKKLYDEQGRAEWSPKNSDTPCMYKEQRLLNCHSATPNSPTKMVTLHTGYTYIHDRDHSPKTITFFCSSY
jgi:hypothetical protein